MHNKYLQGSLFFLSTIQNLKKGPSLADSTILVLGLDYPKRRTLLAGAIEIHVRLINALFLIRFHLIRLQCTLQLTNFSR